MATDNIMSNLAKELAAVKTQRKKDWNDLKKEQDDQLLKSDNAEKLIYRFAKEREDHNKRYDEQIAEVYRRYGQELKEHKKERNRSDDELER